MREMLLWRRLLAARTGKPRYSFGSFQGTDDVRAAIPIGPQAVLAVRKPEGEVKIAGKVSGLVR